MTNTLYIKAYTQDIYDTDNTRMATLIYYMAANYYHQPVSAPIPFEYGTLNPSASPYPLFPDAPTAIAYYKDAQAAAMVSQVNIIIGSTYYTAYDVETIDAAVGASLSQLFAMLAPVATSGNYVDLSGKPTIPNIVTCTHIANATTGLNTSMNVITTLLGTLTGALNTTNSAYNDLATKFNSLLADLQANNILAVS